MATILTAAQSDITRAGTLLRAGELVAVPTETVYGLAANAFCEDAVRRIFSAKGRPFIDPLIVHVHSLEQAETLADISHPFVKKLAEAFWPGPLTLVLPKKKCVPAIVTAGEPTVAVRMPAHPLMRSILRECGLPLAAPSANPFGYVSPTAAQHVQDSLGERISWILDGGSCDCGVESTIVFVADTPRLLRPGVITREDLERVLGVPVEDSKGHLEKLAEEKTESAQLAPGMLKKHYSPRVPVTLFDTGTIPEVDTGVPAAVVFQARPDFTVSEKFAGSTQVFWLSEDGNQAEVARAVFALLRHLDEESFASIFIEKSPDCGIGIAVNDRLSRAAAK